MFRFIHASDLHLGSAFEGIASVAPDAASRLERATYDALERLVQIALAEEAAFVVLAGDVCNRAEGSLRAELALRKAAAALATSGIALFLVYGNHDFLAPTRPDLDWPDNTHVFPPEGGEPRIVERDGRAIATVFGMSYGRRDERENLAARFPKPPRDIFSVAVLHTACGSAPGHEPYAPCKLEDLVDKGYDYWALGHVHNHVVLREAAPAVVYPGSTQGLNPKETGPRGCCVVDVVEDRRVAIRFQPTDSVRWYAETVDIGGMEREQDLLNAMEGRLRHLAEGLEGDRTGLVRFRLAGRGPLHRWLRDERNRTELTEHLLGQVGRLPAPVWTEAVLDETRPEVDLDERREAQDFLGDFLRLSQEIRSNPERLRELAQEAAKQLTAQHVSALRRLGWEVAQLSDEDLARLAAQAETLGADMLLTEER